MKSFLYEVRRADQAASRAFSEAFDRLTLRQYMVLRAVADLPSPCDQTTIVEATGIDRSTLADMLARMQGAGLVLRTVSADDARQKCPSLSAKGRRLLAAAEPHALEAEKIARRLIEDAIGAKTPSARARQRKAA